MKNHLEHQFEEEKKTSLVSFGFWVYLMSDCMLFATLFATYVVLKNNIADGPSAREIINLPFALTETLILLCSSFTCGLGMLALQSKDKTKVLTALIITFLLGVTFVTMEFTEFSHMVSEGNSWKKSAFLSSYFTLVGTHGLHIMVGLLWIIVMLGHVSIRGFTSSTIRRLNCLSMYWHFLDLIWIFIFTIVYLMGAI